MVEENTDVKVEILTEDIRAVMQANPGMTLQLQNRALSRQLNDARAEIIRLTREVEKSRNGKNKKEG
jgi:hypothetical protein